MVHDHLIGQMLDHPSDIVIFGRAVDDHVDVGAVERAIAQTRDHQVVENAALFVQQHRIALAEGLQTLNVAGQQLFERRVHALAREAELAHMADVEQAGLFAHPGMFGHDAFILDRHVIAGEADHARALGTMPGIERQILQRQIFFEMGDVVSAGHERPP